MCVYFIIFPASNVTFVCEVRSSKRKNRVCVFVKEKRWGILTLETVVCVVGRWGGRGGVTFFGFQDMSKRSVNIYVQISVNCSISSVNGHS